MLIQTSLLGLLLALLAALGLGTTHVREPTMEVLLGWPAVFAAALALSWAAAHTQSRKTSGTADEDKKMMKCILIVGLLGVVSSSSLWAKCALATYRFEGLVVSVSDSKPISDARVFLFVDSAETTLTRWDPEHPRSAAITDSNGAFEASGWFDTTSGYSFFTGDRCRRRPKKVEVIVSADGFYPVRRRYHRGDLSIGGQIEQTVVLPETFQLEPAEPQTE